MGFTHHFLQKDGDASPQSIDSRMAILRERYSSRLFCAQLLQRSAHSCAASLNNMADFLPSLLTASVRLSGSVAKAPSDIESADAKENVWGRGGYSDSLHRSLWKK